MDETGANGLKHVEIRDNSGIGPIERFQFFEKDWI